MKVDKRLLGLILGVVVFLVVRAAPLGALAPISPQGQMCLAISLMTVVFWALQVMNPAYVGGLFCVLVIQEIFH